MGVDRSSAIAALMLACTPVPALADAPPAAKPAAALTLAEEVRAARTMDTAGKPAEALAQLDALKARASAARGIAAKDMLYLDAARAGALFWLQRHEESLAIFRQVDAALTAGKYPLDGDRSELTNNIGAVLSSLGKLDEAQAWKERALAMAATLTGKESQEYASALYGIALIDFRRGKPLDALPKVTEALRIARARAEATGNDLDKPAIYGLSLASLQVQAGDAASSIAAAREAALWADSHLGEDHRVTMAALNQLGASLSDAGLYAQSIPVLRRTLDLRAKAYPADHPDIAYSLNALGYAIDNAGDKAGALPFYQRAAEIFRSKPDSGQPLSYVSVAGQIARIARWSGDPALALELRQKAVDFARQRSPAPEHPEVLRAEVALAAELLEAGKPEAARALLDHANAALRTRAVPANPLRLSGALEAARAQAAEHPAAIMAALAQAHDVLAPARARLLDRATPRDVLARLAGQYSSLFVGEARLAAKAGPQAGAAAFEALQLANLGDLQAAFAGLAGLKAGASPEATETIRRYQALAIDTERLRRQLNQAMAANGSGAEALAATLAEAETRLRAADADMARAVPGYAALTAVEPAQLAAAQARLKPGQAMALIGQDGYGLVTLLVTQGGTVAASTPVFGRRLLELQQRVRGSVEAGLLDNGAGSFDRTAAHELYRLLFPGAIGRALGRVRELEVLASGSLSALPFGALVTRAPTGRDDSAADLRRTAWLASRTAIRISIGLTPAPVQPRDRVSQPSFAGIGAPELGPATVLATRSATRLRSGDTSAAALRELSSLPETGRELQRMSTYFPGSHTLLLGAAATETAVKALPLDRTDVLAFATHGLVGGRFRDVVEPALVLTPPAAPGPADDGLLTASEVAKLRLDADWVILSACDTSAGEGESAPTYSGLARAFVSAGARSLLVSHWPVRDDVASRLTVATLDGSRRGMPRAEALRQAQLAVLRDPAVPGGAHPATWAPFVLVGD